jgi:class 3 adenylate cyclase
MRYRTRAARRTAERGTTHRSASAVTTGGPAVPAEEERLSSLPDANPNPVMRIAPDGRVAYANVSSAPILAALGIGPARPAPAALVGSLTARADDASLPPLEIEVEGGRTFVLSVVRDPDVDVLDVYGTDITARKVVEHFPDRNPYPVLRVDRDFRLIYANQASGPIVRGLGLAPGEPLARWLQEAFRAAAGAPVEVRGDHGIFAVRAVAIPEMGFVNIYGNDVTAIRAVDAFPDRNPNPVMRVTHEGVLEYANPASAPIRDALGLDVGRAVPAALLRRIRAAAAADGTDVLETVAGDRTFEVLVVSLPDFESINLYGTDVTAKRLVERTSRENERLLLSILPASIAQRLRDGEVVIADRFDEMAVLFADVVDFTPLSARLSPVELIDTLNLVFSAFDELADKHGLEKIKTVGDSYMVVGGIEGGPDDPAGRLADMGLAMVEVARAASRATGHPLEIRVGMSVGPTVAGVIGVKRFIYDVWGDTVNTASRMESLGVPGRVHVTRATRDRLGRSHAFERRGVIDVKGKGQLETWLLVGRISALASDRVAEGARSAANA